VVNRRGKGGKLIEFLIFFSKNILGSDNCVFVYSENTLKELQGCPKYYFEIKCKSEGGINRVGNLILVLKI